MHEMFKTEAGENVESNDAMLMLDEVIASSKAKAPQLIKESFKPSTLERIDNELFNPYGTTFGSIIDNPDKNDKQELKTKVLLFLED